MRGDGRESISLAACRTASTRDGTASKVCGSSGVAMLLQHVFSAIAVASTYLRTNALGKALGHVFRPGSFVRIYGTDWPTDFHSGLNV